MLNNAEKIITHSSPHFSRSNIQIKNLNVIDCISGPIVTNFLNFICRFSLKKIISYKYMSKTISTIDFNELDCCSFKYVHSP